jgi:ubiquinone/menaquinone biosynthesis C-methylase UbiE
MKAKDEPDSAIKLLSGKGLFPPKYAFTLLLPLRNIFISPKELIKRLELSKNSVVLEVGPGPGYFSLHVARALTEGRIYLADIQQEMLDIARKRLTKRKISNVEYYLCNGTNLPIADETFDVIFMVTVLGEIENKNQYMEEFSRIIRKNGILSISEQAGDPDKMDPGEIENLVGGYGFITTRFYGTKKNFTMNFRLKS